MPLPGDARLSVQVLLGQGPNSYDFDARYDQSRYDDPEQTAWVEVSCEADRLRCRTGAASWSGPLTRPEAGELTARMRDPDGNWDPMNTDGPYDLRPGLPVRVMAGIGAADTPLWSGWANPGWRADVRGRTCEVQAADAVAELARVPFEKWNLPAQTATARVAQLLAAVPRVTSQVSAGGKSLIAQTLEKSNVWQAILDTTDAEQGLVMVAPDGILNWWTRAQLAASAAAPPIAELHCHDTLRAVYTDLVSVVDDDWLINSVTAGRYSTADPAPDPVTLTDDLSVAYHGQRGISVQDLPLADDAALSEWADHVLDGAAWPSDRPESVVFRLDDVHPDPNTTLMALLGLQIGDPVTLVHDRDGARRVLVRGIGHEIEDGTWTSTLVLQSAAEAFVDEHAIYDLATYDAQNTYGGMW